MEQRCNTPLEKLVLIYLSDAIGDEAFGSVSILKLNEFCCASGEDVANAVLDLDERQVLQVFGAADDKLEVAFSWYRPAQGRQRQPVDVTLVRYSRLELLKEQGGKCWYCGCAIHADPKLEPFSQLEHQHPRSRGGRSSKENIVLACRPCNIRKKDRTVEEFRAWMEARNGTPVEFHGERTS